MNRMLVIAVIVHDKPVAFKVVSTKQIRLPAGPALLIKYESESEANPVTNKRIHLEDEAYAFYKNGRMAILTVWAPAGADNADQWKLISESFRCLIESEPLQLFDCMRLC